VKSVIDAATYMSSQEGINANSHVTPTTAELIKKKKTDQHCVRVL